MKKCLAIILTFTTILSFGIISFNEFRKSTVITYEEARQFADDVKELNAKNYDISNRLILSSNKDINTMGAVDTAVCADNTYVLQYSSKEAMQKAYEYYSSLSYVENVTRDEEVTTICEDTDDSFDFEAQCTSTARTNIDDAIKLIYEENIELPEITVGIVDSGVSITPITQSRFDGGHTYSNKFKSDGTEDIKGHGTKVAGTIILNTPDNVRIRSYQALNEDGRGSTTDIYAQMILAISEGCNIINCSFIGPTSQYEYQKLADYAEEKGVILVCASGNDSKDLANYNGYPARIENFITVGAITISNSISSSFANYGDVLDIYAPGYGLKYFKYDENNNLTLGRWSGTSAAAPVISAVTSLLLTINPKMTYKEIEDLFILTGSAVDDDNCTQANRLNVDAYGAVKYLLGSELEQCTIHYNIEKNKESNYTEAMLDTDCDSEIWYCRVYSNYFDKAFPEQKLYQNYLYDNSPIQANSYYNISACALAPHKAKSDPVLFMLPLYYNKKDYVITKSASENENNILKQCCITDQTIIDIPSVIDGVEIQEIGAMCFAGNPTAETIILPESIKVIGAYAFADCPNLKTVIAPGVTECKHAAFYASDKLENVSIPNLSTANTALFKNCSSLKNVQCKPLTQICNQAFYECQSLETLEIADNDLSFSANTFNGCKNLTLSVQENSYMHRFAIENNIAFKLKSGLSEEECSHKNTQIIKELKKNCYNNGYIVYSCPDCSHVYTLFDYCTGHEYESETVMPTCTDYEHIHYRCKNCPNSYNVRTGNYLVPHNTYTVVYRNATESKTGRAYTYCRNCDSKLPDTILPSLAPYTVKGTTIIAEDRNLNSKNHYPLANVSITINDELVAVTDKNGMFYINLGNGNYTAHLTHPSGFDRTISFTVENRSVTIEKPIPMIACDWYKDGIINAKDYAKLINSDTVYGYDMNGDYLINDTEYKIFENCITY